MMLLPAALRSLSFEPSTRGEPDFHLHPRYREQRPIGATLLKVPADHDNFVSEIHAESIGRVLESWSRSLRDSVADVGLLGRTLAPGFRGSSLRAREVRMLRTGIVDVTQHGFGDENSRDRNAFLDEWRSFLKEFTKLYTADFFITSIDADNPTQIKTRVRYEFVGTGAGFYREQRVGYWEMDWESNSEGLTVDRWKVLEETRSRSSAPPFEEITGQALGSNPAYSEQLLHGSDYWRTVLDGASGIDIYGHNGISLGDIDNDGYDDLYICQPAGLPNRLFRNRGDGTFQDVTEASGVGVLENTACALFVDTNNNGRQDLVVVRTNGPLLFLNEGGGKFRLQPDAFRFATPAAGTFTGAAAADYDRDGWLDIYFCLYAYYQGSEQYSYPVPYYDAQNGPANFLFRNNRDGTFVDVTAQARLNQNNTRYSFCCAWNDYDGDGWPDLYVVNDFGRKNLYHNNGDGTFTDVASPAGADDVGAGMSVAWLDSDNNGTPDLYVANMWTAAGERLTARDAFQSNASAGVRELYRKHAMGNSLLKNQGAGFRDVTATSGTGMGRWAWSSDAWDFDHDGFQDLYVTNGMVSGPSLEDLNSFFWRQVVARSPNMVSSSPEYEQGWNAINELIRADGTWSGYERNVFYANNRDGTFSDVSGAIGLDFLEDGRSFALGDLDHDGKQEVVLKNRNAPQVRILRNVISNLPPSIAFCLQGTKSNRDGIGAMVTIETAAGQQTRTVQAGSGFLSQHSKELLFGLGEVKEGIRASIRWPSGLVQRLTDLPVNHRIWVEEGSLPPKIEPFRARTTVPNSARKPAQGDTIPDTIGTWLLAPVVAPEISLPDLSGRTITLTAFRGKPVLVHFWVVESQECKQDLKLLQNRAPVWKSRGLRLLTVNFDAATEAVRGFASQQRFSLPILRASEDISAIYNLLYRYLFDRHRDLALPTSFLIDSDGNIVKIYQGPLKNEEVEYDFQNLPNSVPERAGKALPFPGIGQFEIRRNYLSLGSVFFQHGYINEAGDFFQSALRQEPRSAEALYGIGSVQLKQDKLAEAKESFSRATQSHGTYPDTLANSWNNLGIIATREGQMTEAVRYFQKAVETNAGYLVGLVNLGNANRELKQWDKAAENFQKAVQLAPDDPEANYGFGMVYAQMEDSEHAREYLLKALQARPAYPEALNNLGILCLRTHRREEAVARFQQCIRLAPAFDQSYLNLARVYMLEGDREKARNTLIELLKQHPDHAQAKEMLQQLN